jgi:hypothetical protein
MNKSKVPIVPTYKHNSLFTRGDDIRLNACVGPNGGPYDFRDYAHGYFKAAARLIESMRKDVAHVDIIVYPLCFLYRHGTELALKWLARELSIADGAEEQPRLTHRLYDNWTSVRTLLERNPSAFDVRTAVPFVDAALKDFLEFDPNGEVFRYPEDRQGKLHLQDARIINLQVLGDAMSKVGDIFDFWFYCTDSLLGRAGW